jgi:hypothetical protein
MRARILLLLWRAWHLRNDCIHHDGKATIAESVSFLKAYLQEPYIQVCVHTDVKGNRHCTLLGEATIARVLVCATGRLD